MRYLTLLTLAIASAGAYAVPLNGSFEVNTVNTGFQHYFGDVADDWTPFTGIYPNASPDVWDDNGVDGNQPGLSTLMTGVTAPMGTKFAALGSNYADGFSEGIESARTTLDQGIYTFYLQMLYDDANLLGYVNPGVLEVYTRSSGGLNHLGTLAPNTAAKTWESRKLTLHVDQTDTMSFVISNENLAATYIGVDDVLVYPVPEPATLAILGLGCLAARRRLR